MRGIEEGKVNAIWYQHRGTRVEPLSRLWHGTGEAGIEYTCQALASQCATLDMALMLKVRFFWDGMEVWSPGKRQKRKSRYVSTQGMSKVELFHTISSRKSTGRTYYEEW